MKLLKEKLILSEDNDKVNGDEEVLPDAMPEEPIVVSTEVPAEVDDEIIKNAQSGVISDLMKQKFDMMENYKGAIATLSIDEKEYTKDVVDILNAVMDEESIIIGKLSKASSLIDGEQSELMQQGEDKAEEILAGKEFPVDESLKLKED